MRLINLNLKPVQVTMAHHQNDILSSMVSWWIHWINHPKKILSKSAMIATWWHYSYFHRSISWPQNQCLKINFYQCWGWNLLFTLKCQDQEWCLQLHFLNHLFFCSGRFQWKKKHLKNCFSSRKLHYNIDNAIQQGLEWLRPTSQMGLVKVSATQFKSWWLNLSQFKLPGMWCLNCDLNSVPWQLSNQNDANSKSAKQRSKTGWTRLWSWSVRNKEKCARNCTSWSPEGSWWTKFHCVVLP